MGVVLENWSGSRAPAVVVASESEVSRSLAEECRYSSGLVAPRKHHDLMVGSGIMEPIILKPCSIRL
jgi:hypothetical protein